MFESLISSIIFDDFEIVNYPKEKLMNLLHSVRIETSETKKVLK